MIHAERLGFFLEGSPRRELVYPRALNRAQGCATLLLPRRKTLWALQGELERSDRLARWRQLVGLVDMGPGSIAQPKGIHHSRYPRAFGGSVPVLMARPSLSVRCRRLRRNSELVVGRTRVHVRVRRSHLGCSEHALIYILDVVSTVLAISEVL